MKPFSTIEPDLKGRFKLPVFHWLLLVFLLSGVSGGRVYQTEKWLAPVETIDVSTGFADKTLAVRSFSAGKKKVAISGYSQSGQQILTVLSKNLTASIKVAFIHLNVKADHSISSILCRFRTENFISHLSDTPAIFIS